ncbi:YrhB domain-containing protein [Streptomyces sp. NPDC002643]
MPVPVADPQSLGLPPDAAMGSTIQPWPQSDATAPALARVFASRSGQPGVREAPSPFWIVDGPSDARWCSVRPVAPDVHDVHAADGTHLGTVTRRAGRVLPWPRRVRWSVRLTATPLSVTGKEGTWYAWFLYVALSPVLFLFVLFLRVGSFFDGQLMEDYSFRPVRTRWHLRGYGMALDYRGIEQIYRFAPRLLDARVAYALAVLQTWHARDKDMAHPPNRGGAPDRDGAERRMPREEAVSAAARFLMAECYPDRPDSVVMLADTAVEYAYGWTVRFDFREHIETGDPAKAPFSSVVVVPRDGTPVHFAPTFPPPETYMMTRAMGLRPPGTDDAASA